MIQIELPICFYENYKEVNLGEEQGIEVEGIQYVKKATLYIPLTERFEIFPYEKENNQTSIAFKDTGYKIDLDYETVRMLLNDAINKSR